MDTTELIANLRGLGACSSAIEHIKQRTIEQRTWGLSLQEDDLKRLWEEMHVSWQVWYLVRHGWPDVREVVVPLLTEMATLTGRGAYRDVAIYWTSGHHTEELLDLSRYNYLLLRIYKGAFAPPDRKELTSLIDELVRIQCMSHRTFPSRLAAGIATLFPFEKIRRPGQPQAPDEHLTKETP